MKKDPKFDRKAFKKAMAMIESTGGKYMTNLASSAAGRYQFLFNLIKDDPDMKGVSKRQFINDDRLQELIMDKALDGTLKGYPGYYDSAYELKSEYNTNLRPDEIAMLVHYVGKGGTRKYLNNPSKFKVPGKTNEDVFSRITKFNEAQGTIPSYIENPKIDYVPESEWVSRAPSVMSSSFPEPIIEVPKEEIYSYKAYKDYEGYPPPEHINPLSKNNLNEFHDGGPIGHIHDEDKVKSVFYGSSEYDKAYNEGTIYQKFEEGEWKDVPTELDEVVMYDIDKKEYPYFDTMLTESQKKDFFKPKTNAGNVARRLAKLGKKDYSDKVVNTLVAPPLYTTAAGMLAPTAGAALVGGAETAGAAALPYLEGAMATSLPGLSSIPGATVGNALNVAFGYDFLANRAPEIPKLIKEGKYDKATLESLYGAADMAGLGLLNAAKFKNLHKAIDGKQESFNFSKLFKKLNNKQYYDYVLSKTDSGAFLRELLGNLFGNKKNVQAIEEGNQWLKKWISDFDTRKKVEKLYDDAIKADKAAILNSDFDVPDAVINQKEMELFAEQHFLSDFEPRTKQWPLKEQLIELFAQKGNVHKGNYGISYSHDKPVLDNEFYDKLGKGGGSYVSRSPFISFKKKKSTTIHEGVHDWFKDAALNNTKLKEKIFDLYSDSDKDLYDQWLSDPSKLNKSDRYRGYMLDPTEIHARIMELRHQYDIEPDTSITDSLIKRILNDYDNWIITGKHVIKELFDKDKLKYLFKTLPGAGAGVASQSNQKAYGGTLNQYDQGGYLEVPSTATNEQRFVEFKTGGTHEQNPYGGVIIGKDSKGVPNAVEQNETKFIFKKQYGYGGQSDDGEDSDFEYIFSDRLTI